ncbi:cyclase [Microtetraspora sp. NBRC 13810]|uniref:aromatase/cyclase n=1 Tax=Microtetraspora sp. NBRC 13810 TaxID=3030990 RepID=UPI0025567196|nr:aromatase/cyclase [Microtetraspora sp. NBRC 13810]GLW10123.1 cyclase [Microtetraspora sp. NBRC 13810]
MRHVTVKVLVRDADPGDAYLRVGDFARYPELTATVHEVVVHPQEDAHTHLSDWTVSFRNGLLRWTERDTFDPGTRSISFTQVSGDFMTFEGTWLVEPATGGSTVTFTAAFDLGIPSLAEILDPVASAALSGNILQILRGLFGEVNQVTETPAIMVT